VYSNVLLQTTSQASGPTSPSTASKGLSTGVKAGIGIGVILGILALIILFLAAFWYRRRRNSTRRGLDPRPGQHELGADPNQPELLANSNLHEMEQEKQGVMASRAEIDSKPPRVLKQRTESHELDPNSRMLGLELQSNDYPVLHELDIASKPAVTAPFAPVPPQPGQGFSMSRKPVAGSAAQEEDDQRGEGEVAEDSGTRDFRGRDETSNSGEGETERDWRGFKWMNIFLVGREESASEVSTL
jgi:FtsZ-interacting cell division protein ZipA